jgi:hypothetical protein
LDRIFLVPRKVTPTSVTLWVAAENVASLDDLQLVPTLPGQQPPGNAGQWPPDAPQPRLRYQEILVGGLAPGQTCSFSLMQNGAAVAEATVTTLPQGIPAEGDGRFIVLLGSCFSRLEDLHGKVGRSFGDMPTLDRPHIKIFCGDQVYLDSPSNSFLGLHSIDVLRQRFYEHYTETWGTPQGLATLLKAGANYFCSDDHEYWNNAPNMAPHLQDTWTGHRQEWWDTGRALYGAFQNAAPIQRIDVPPVSFLIADTRMNRSRDETNFMLPPDLDAVGNWIDGLQGPGVLVVGQPLLQATTGFFRGSFFDWNLPDYDQYLKLTTMIGQCRHSLVVLTGDVHYGRVASSPLRSGAELIEIISSPLSLVDPLAKGKWEKVPEHTAPAALAPAGLFTKPDFTPVDSHFLTLEFTRRGAGANLKLRYWPIIDEQGTASPDFGKQIWEKALT